MIKDNELWGIVRNGKVIISYYISLEAIKLADFNILKQCELILWEEFIIHHLSIGGIIRTSWEEFIEEAKMLGYRFQQIENK